MPQPPPPPSKPNSINCQTNVIYGYAKSILTICHMYAVILAYTDRTYTNGTPLNLFPHSIFNYNNVHFYKFYENK